MNMLYNSALAGSAIAALDAAAQAQANNAKNFETAIEELSVYFSGAVATTFMQQVSTHCADLQTDASNMSGIASSFTSIKSNADTQFAQVSRNGGI